MQLDVLTDISLALRNIFLAYQLMKTRESNGLQQLIERIGHPRRKQDYAVTILQVVSIIINVTV